MLWRWISRVQNFHLGKPILVLAAIALLAGAAVSVRPAQPKADLTIWIFAESHYQIYRRLLPTFEQENHVKVNLNLLNARGETIRLGQLFMADLDNPELPDLAEMEISLVGRYFRPPVNEVGFLPLNGYVQENNYDERLVKQRLAPWSKEAVVFGMPHDVHPCTITYRHDLFTEAGVDLPAAKTWPQFQDACVKFEKYWRERGYPTRHALEMSESSSENFQAMLLQRGINPIDMYGNVYVDTDPRVAQTLAFYGQLVAGPRKCTAQTSQGWGPFSKDVSDGNLCAFLTPDWRIIYIKQYGPSLAGKMRMMPLPVFDSTDAPTSTLGGTMMGITRKCKHPDLAWKLLQYLYYSKDAQAADPEILPPLKERWTDPFYHQPDPYFGGQKAQELFTQLAPHIPNRYVTPASGIANMALNEAVARAVRYVEEHGADAGLEPACKQWCAEIADDLRARMKQWRIDS